MKKIIIAGFIMANAQLSFGGMINAGGVMPGYYIVKNPVHANLQKKSAGKNLSPGIKSSLFFELKINKGEKLGNIFSRTISYKGNDFTELAYRAGGTGIYTTIDNNPRAPVFDGVFRYDGRPENRGKVEISDNGKTSAYNGKSSVNTDASGVMFNSLIWGTPPGRIKKGDAWKVDIAQPRELGSPGKQVATVIEMDEKNGTIRLKREGTCEGFYDNDAKQLAVTKGDKSIKMDVSPGASHWVGYTIFKQGLIISDELLVTRPVTLTAESLKFDATEREYVLLNATPVL